MKQFSINRGVPGFLFAGISSGIKKSKKDLGMIFSEAPCAAAGVFTKSRVKAAPVLLCKKRIKKGFMQAILVNSGNANACTGKNGLIAAADTCAEVSSCLGIKDSLVVPCSTGVIGVEFPSETIIRALPELVKRAGKSAAADFAESILTTDTYSKTAAFEDVIDGENVKVCGIAKGAGMIMPDMATMLAFIVTNVSIENKLLASLLKDMTEETFNRITVDGDMSTNDTVLILANGKAGKPVTRPNSRAFKVFANMLYETMKILSLMIVKDGEGATKMITVNVVRAKTMCDAKKAARSVANSNLVKTAFFGEDFNWGRIMAALGASGALFDMNRVDIFFNDIAGVKNGESAAANIGKLEKIATKDEISITIDLKNGRQACEVATCDLSYEYVKINADYTT